MTRLRGRAPRGKRLYASAPQKSLVHNHYDLFNAFGWLDRLYDHRGSPWTPVFPLSPSSGSSHLERQLLTSCVHVKRVALLDVPSQELLG